MSGGKSSSSGGIGFCGLLTIVFIVLKLTDHIGWSWWWVLSPVWIAAVLGVIVLAIGFAVAVAHERPKHSHPSRRIRL